MPNQDLNLNSNSLSSNREEGNHSSNSIHQSHIMHKSHIISLSMMLCSRSLIIILRVKLSLLQDLNKRRRPNSKAKDLKVKTQGFRNKDRKTSLRDLINLEQKITIKTSKVEVDHHRSLDKRKTSKDLISLAKEVPSQAVAVSREIALVNLILARKSLTLLTISRVKARALISQRDNDFPN